MILQEVDLFKEIDPGIMNEIANICSEENYAKDTVLFKKGEEASSLYILEEGSVRLVIENGGTITFGLDHPGEVFGWSSMVESGHYTSSGVCATESKVLKIAPLPMANIDIRAECLIRYLITKNPGPENSALSRFENFVTTVSNEVFPLNHFVSFLFAHKN
jgi:CRP-like cAMP-binding protein